MSPPTLTLAIASPPSLPRALKTSLLNPVRSKPVSRLPQLFAEDCQ